MDKQLKILMCCHLPLQENLGAAKVYIETAETYKSLGHSVTLVGYNEITDERNFPSEDEKLLNFPYKLKTFIKSKDKKFDVIEFEYLYLPYDRNEFDAQVIMVARSTLLVHHLKNISFPLLPTVRAYISNILKSHIHRQNINFRIKQANQTFDCCDYINIPNYDDKEILLKGPISEEKIIVSPYGINHYSPLKQRKRSKKIAFIGSFDRRKGCVEMPKILNELILRDPEIRLKLMGTNGLFPDKQSVINFFPNSLKSNIEVIDQFNKSDLNDLLSDCSIGIFPSHLESFGFGLLEMYSNGLPTVCYDVPGPGMLSPESLKVSRGDWYGISEVCLKLLTDNSFYKKSQEEIYKVVKKYNWKDQALKATEVYLRHKKGSN